MRIFQACKSYPVSVFLPPNFNKFTEYKYYFVGNLVLVLVVKLPLTTSAGVPGSTPGRD